MIMLFGIFGYYERTMSRAKHTIYFNKVHTIMTTQDRLLVNREGDLLDIPPPGPYAPRDPSLNLLGLTSASTDGASITQLARVRRI